MDNLLLSFLFEALHLHLLSATQRVRGELVRLEKEGATVTRLTVEGPNAVGYDVGDIACLTELHRLVDEIARFRNSFRMYAEMWGPINKSKGGNNDSINR